MIRRARLALLVALSAAPACRGGPGPVATAKAGAERAAPASSEPRAESGETVVLFFGDSLSAGYGLPAEQAFPAVIESRLEAEGLSVRSVNAGLSGDTTAGGLRRLDWVLRANRPDVVVVELGANDGLRGLPLEQTEANLRAIVEACRAAGAEVLLAGMILPPNYGPDYSGRFAAIFPRLARDMDLPLIPFLLEAVAGREELNLQDGLHPNREGHGLVAGTVLEHLRPLLRSAED